MNLGNLRLAIRVILTNLREFGGLLIPICHGLGMRSTRTIVKLALAGAEYRDWYRYAQAEIRFSATSLDISADKLAALLAVCSPRVSVKRSIRFALMLLKRPNDKPADMMSTVYAAVRHWQRTGEIRGPKTGPFAKALLGDLSAVVLDVWMAVAFGVPHVAWNRRKLRTIAQDRVRQAARVLGWRPAEVQAAVWAAVVKAAGRKVAFLHVSSELSLFG